VKSKSRANLIKTVSEKVVRNKFSNGR